MSAPLPSSESEYELFQGIRQKQQLPTNDGFTLVETMVAAVLLLIVFFGMAQVYSRGRLHLRYEEERRQATAFAQSHLDNLRRSMNFEDLADLDGIETNQATPSLNYLITNEVSMGVPDEHAATIRVTVDWQARVAGTNVPRSINCTTIMSKSMSWTP